MLDPPQDSPQQLLVDADALAAIAKEIDANPSPTRVAAAVLLNSIGLPVIGANGKKPLKGSHGVYDAISKEADVQTLWMKNPGLNVAIPNGSVSGVVQIDCDRRHGWDGTSDSFPPTGVRILTKDGMRFVYLTALSLKVPTRKIKAGVQLQGDGTYSLWPPSIHPSGKAYRFTFDGDRKPGLLERSFWENLPPGKSNEERPLPEEEPLEGIPSWYLDMWEDKECTHHVDKDGNRRHLLGNGRHDESKHEDHLLRLGFEKELITSGQGVRLLRTYGPKAMEAVLNRSDGGAAYLSSTFWDAWDGTHSPGAATTEPPGEPEEERFRSKLVPGRWHRQYERPPLRHWIENMTTEGLIASWGGYSGAGKTPTELMKVDALFTGQSDFLGYTINPVPDGFQVIYLTEESTYLFEAHVEAAGMSDAALDRMKIAYWDENYGIPWEQMVHEQVLRLNGNGLLVVDTAFWWAGVMDAGAEKGSENDSGIMAKLYRPLVKGVGTGIAIDVLVHCPKLVLDLKRDAAFHLGHIRGSGAVVANSAYVFGLKVPAVESRRSNQRYLKVLRDKLTGRTDALYTHLSDAGLKRLGGLAGADVDVEERTLEDKVLEAIPLLRDVGDRATGAAIASFVSVRKQDVYPVLNALTKTGQVVRISEKEGYRLGP